VTVTYNTDVINQRLQVVVDAIDAGAASGTLHIGTAGMGTTLAIITLSDPSATVAVGVLTFAGLPKATIAIGSGIPAAAQIYDSNNVLVITDLTVAQSGADVIVNQSTITAGDTVTLIAVSQITGH